MNELILIIISHRGLSRSLLMSSALPYVVSESWYADEINPEDEVTVLTPGAPLGVVFPVEGPPEPGLILAGPPPAAYCTTAPAECCAYGEEAVAAGIVAAGATCSEHLGLELPRTCERNNWLRWTHRIAFMGTINLWGFLEGCRSLQCFPLLRVGMVKGGTLGERTGLEVASD